MKSIKELLGLEEAKAKKMKGDDPCWDSHEMVGMKKGKGGKPVPNCVPKNEEVEDVTEMENRSKENDDHERREYGPEGTKKREKKTQELLKKVSPGMRKKMRLPEPKEDVAEGTNNINALVQKLGDTETLVHQTDGYKRKMLMKKRDELESRIGAMPGGKEALKRWASDYDKSQMEDVAEGSVKTPKITFAQKIPGSNSLIDIFVDGRNEFLAAKIGTGIWSVYPIGEGQSSIGAAGSKSELKKKVLDYLSKQGVAEGVEIAEAKVGDTVSFHHELHSAPGTKVKKSGTVEKVEGGVVHVKVKDKYGVKRHQVKMGDLVKEDTELEEASDTKRPPNFTMYPIDRQDYKILRKPKKALPKSGKEWGRDAGEKKIKEEVDQIDELNKDTVYSYNKKADADVEKKHKSLGQLMRKGDAAGANKASHQINRRLAGMERAEKRLNKEEVELDEAEAVKKVKMTPQERSYKRKIGLKAVVQEAVKKMREKKGDPSQSKDVKKGEQLSGKQEPVKVNPELQVK